MKLPRAGILTVGDELVGGRVVNTNAAFLTQRLTEQGFFVTATETVGDEEFAIADAVEALCKRTDAVFVAVGEAVLAGGEAAALVLLEACVRLLPGVLGNDQSTVEESFAGGGSRRPFAGWCSSWRSGRCSWSWGGGRGMPSSCSPGRSRPWRRRS